MMNFGNVRLVGMTPKDVQKMYSFDIRVNPANGLQTPYMMPDDVILNTRRAFNTSPTSLTGYSDLGVPEGRYFAPANSSGSCIQLKSGDCAPRTLMIRDPVANPGSGAAIFQSTTAYRDPANNFDPGGRLGQVSFRLNW